MIGSTSEIQQTALILDFSFNGLSLEMNHIRLMLIFSINWSFRTFSWKFACFIFRFFWWRYISLDVPAIEVLVGFCSDVLYNMRYSKHQLIFNGGDPWVVIQLEDGPLRIIYKHTESWTGYVLYNIYLELKKSRWPMEGGRTVRRLPCRWSSLSPTSSPISWKQLA